MASEIVKLVGSVWPVAKTKKNGGRRIMQMPMLIRIAGGYKSWNER